jgi:hypothetical protein
MLLPASINSGDLLLAFMGSTAGNISGGGWASVGANQLAIWKKTADGTEDGTTNTVTYDSTCRFAALVYCIRGWNSVSISAFNTSITTPDCAPGLGAKDFLWLSCTKAIGYPVTYDAAPTNYLNKTSVESGTSGSVVNIGVATRELNAASENPADDWTLTGSTSNLRTVTLGIEPATARTATPAAASGAPGTTVVVSLTNFSGTPTGVTFNGVSASFSGNSTSITVTLPALSTFVSAGSHAATRWDTNYTMTVSESGGSANATFQIDPPDTNGPTYWFYAAGATPYPGDTVHPVATAQNDDVFVEVASGTMYSVNSYGATSWSAVPGQALVRIYDVSGASWSTVVTWDFYVESVVNSNSFTSAHFISDFVRVTI